MVVTASLVVLGLAGSGSGRGRAFVRLSLRIPLLQLLLDHLGHLFAFGLVAAVALVDRIQDLCHGLFATLQLVDVDAGEKGEGRGGRGDVVSW